MKFEKTVKNKLLGGKNGKNNHQNDMIRKNFSTFLLKIEVNQNPL